MLIELGNESKLIDSATPGYNSCGCGNRRYYTKAEIDEMLAGLMDEDKIKEIIDQLFLDYVEENDFVEIILNAIGDIYTQDQIDALLSELESRIKTWVEAKGYLTDISLTINGQTLHNGDSIDIQGGGGSTPDMSNYATRAWVTAQTNLAILTATENETARTENTYAKLNAFNQFKSEMESCCGEVNDKIDELEVIIANLQEQIDNITGGTTPDTGDTPDTGSTPDTGDTPTPDNRPRVITRFNVTSTTEPTQILYAIGDNLSDIKDGNGNQIPISLYYTFPSLGEQTLIFYYKNGTFTDRQQWYGLKQIVFAQQIGVTAGPKAFENSSLAHLTTRNGASYAYRNCKNLTTLDLGIGWGSVATEVFNGCSSLVMDFVISDEGTKIGNGAFKGTKIRTLTIPQTVTTIYGTCLNGCTEMQYVRFLGTTPPETVKDGAFSNGTYPIYVPSSAVNTYKTKLPAYASRIQAWNG